MNHFLTDPGIHKKKYESFEIEKSNFIHAFEVKIYHRLEALHIRVNKQKRCILVNVQPFVFDFGPTYKQQVEDFIFQLPENIMTDNYHISEEHTVTCITFYKKEHRIANTLFSESNIYNEIYW